ncbi:hypothetical protein BN1195_02877 [Chryseobacterium oranimense G311]|uniref:hypothetical protein n=1 Tax=Chryseobacterium oranimense TaxID=421058 RepID=UPI00053379C4|nr:hypothetical protein [Chryseobacterium oranimense]CEJ70550.1 hypothetical protein BN1195_02877 [Chryseobacterium oranimense G311]
METIKYGEYITPELSKILSKYLTRQDLTTVHKQTGVSASNLNQIRTMNNVVTERSKEAMNKLLTIAYKNADDEEKEAKKGKRQIKQILNCI